MNFASISVSSSGDNTILAGVTNKKIRVLTYTLICASDVTVTWKSGSNTISGAMSLAANGGMCPSAGQETAMGPLGLIQSTNQGEALILNLSSALQVSGHLTYILVD